MTGLKETLGKNLRSKNFDELEKPLWITVTNYKTGKPEYIHKGNLLNAVIASSSIPALFRPYKIGGEYYVDGGVTNNFPVEALAGKCEKLVGAYVDPVGIVPEPRGVFHTALRSFQLSISSQVSDKKKALLYYIEPEDLARYGLLEVSKGLEMFEIGYRTAIEVLKEGGSSRED
jgi:NTE family protein